MSKKDKETTAVEGAEVKAKKPIYKKWWFWVIVVVAIIIIASAAGGSDEPTKVDSNGETVASDNTDTTQTEFAVGDTVDLSGVQVTLESAEISNGVEYFEPADGKVYVVLIFDIVNNSSSDISVSSIASFEAYVDDASVNDTYLTDEDPAIQGLNTLDGSVAVGKKIRGYIAYEVPENYQKLEVHFVPDFWSSKDITFIVNNG